MADLNKTELTLRVTEAAALWFQGVGCKPVETEVPVETGWIADLAALWYPSMTEAEWQKLIPRTPKYNYQRISEEIEAYQRK